MPISGTKRSKNRIKAITRGHANVNIVRLDFGHSVTRLYAIVKCFYLPEDGEKDVFKKKTIERFFLCETQTFFVKIPVKKNRSANDG